MVDGIVKFVTKGDFNALGSKQKEVDIQKANAELGAARDFGLQLVTKGALQRGQFIDLIGLLRVRIGAHECKKGKQTFEEIEYESRTHILSLFLQGVTEKLKANGPQGLQGVIIPDVLQHALLVQTPQSVQEKTSDSKQDRKQLSVNEVSSPAHAAELKGFSIGTLAYERTQGWKEGVYAIKSIGEHVFMMEVDVFKEDLLEINVPLSTLLNQWKAHVGELPTYVADDWTPKIIGFTDASHLEAVRCRLFLALKEFYTTTMPEEPMYEMWQLCQKPQCLRAKVEHFVNLGKKQLPLYRGGGDPHAPP